MSDIIRKLQQRIDKRSNWITENEAKYRQDWHLGWGEIIQQHTLDKRIMGELLYSAKRLRAMTKNFLEA